MSESRQWSPEDGGKLIEQKQKRQKVASKPSPPAADKSASKAKEKK